MVKFYRKKPMVIQALQWTGSNFSEIAAFMKCDNPDYFDASSNCKFYAKGDELVIKTLEGDMVAPANSYIIRGVQGEYYPCKENIFLETYETVV